MTRDPVDVLVVGAGSTGLTLALQAADHGAAVRVVEQRAEQFRPSRALIVHPRTLEVLRPLGVTDALIDCGDVTPQADLHLAGRVVRAQLDAFDLPDTAFPHLLLVRQTDLESILTAAVERRGVPIERGTAATRVEGCRDGALVFAGDDRQTPIECRYVAGCDGPTSIVRAAMQTTWDGSSYGEEVVLADVELAGDLEPGIAHAAPGPGGVVLLFALGEHATWRLLATRPARHDGLPFGQPGPPLPADELDQLLATSGLPARITGIGWSAQIPLQHRIAGRYRSGPLFLAGDAAHTHSPAGGQGMNTGIQDATNLGWKLAFAAHTADAHDDRGTLLDSYDLERRPVARRVIRLTNAVFWAEAGTDPFARAARRAAAMLGPIALPGLLRRRRLLAAGVRVLGQLQVHYRRSPLSINGSHRSKDLLRAGDRLPDASVTTADGPTRLHDLAARAGVHLLLQRHAAAPDPTGPSPMIHSHRLTNIPGTGILAIRPDGYVGFAGDHADADALAKWLAVACAEQRCITGSMTEATARTCVRSGHPPATGVQIGRVWRAGDAGTDE